VVFSAGIEEPGSLSYLSQLLMRWAALVWARPRPGGRWGGWGTQAAAATIIGRWRLVRPSRVLVFDMRVSLYHYMKRDHRARDWSPVVGSRDRSLAVQRLYSRPRSTPQMAALEFAPMVRWGEAASEPHKLPTKR